MVQVAKRKTSQSRARGAEARPKAPPEVLPQAPAELPGAADWPSATAGRDVVLHTRVVTETGGGPDKTILVSASHLADTRYWVAAAYMHPPDDPGFDAIRARAREYGCPLIGVPDRGPLDRGVFRQLLHICRHYNVRIWHGHDYKSNLLGLTLRPFWSMKLVSTVHGWVKQTSRTPLYYAIDRWCLPFYHHVMCVSDDLLEMVHKLGVPAERSSLILNAIDEQRFARQGPPAAAPLRKMLNVPAGRRVIGAMGRLSPEKGFGDLIRAVQSVLSEGQDVELWIAGAGDHRPELERLIEHLDLGERVRLLGFCADTIGFYEALDMFALSSLREGLPNVVLEAMAMRVPVVSTRVAGVPRLIDDGQTGLLCPISDVPALAAAMRRVLADPALAQRLADSARALIERDFSFARRMQREQEVYDRVMGG